MRKSYYDILALNLESVSSKLYFDYKIVWFKKLIKKSHGKINVSIISTKLNLKKSVNNNNKNKKRIFLEAIELGAKVNSQTRCGRKTCALRLLNT